MDEAIVTISLSEYNQLRDNAAINHLLLEKITGYEVQMNNLNQKLFEMENRIYSLEQTIRKS